MMSTPDQRSRVPLEPKYSRYRALHKSGYLEHVDGPEVVEVVGNPQSTRLRTLFTRVLTFAYLRDHRCKFFAWEAQVFQIYPYFVAQRCLLGKGSGSFKLQQQNRVPFFFPLALGI